MIGYAFVNNEWFICKFEHNNLFITKTKCNKPRIIIEEIKIPENMIFVVCENGSLYYFDKTSSMETKLFSEYYQCMYENLNYYVMKNNYTNFSFGKIRKISLVGGIISAMLQLIDPFKITLCLDSKNISVLFNIKQETSTDLCLLEHGNLILNGDKKFTKYSIDIEFNETNDLSFVYKIIYKMYDFIRFINCDFAPYIQEVEIYTDVLKLDYIDNKINHHFSKITNYNYISNVKDKVENILNYIFTHENCKFNFLSLLDKSEIKFEETNILAEVIDAISPQYDTSLNDSIAEEINIYRTLKGKIKETIANFEKENNLTIDDDKKYFMLGFVEMSKFRQKVEYLLSCYNKYADVYNSFYITLSEDIVKKMSKDIQTERNKIHGNCDVEVKGYIYEVQYVLFGLLIYISNMCDLSYSEIFNLFHKTFECRIQKAIIDK